MGATDTAVSPLLNTCPLTLVKDSQQAVCARYASTMSSLLMRSVELSEKYSQKSGAEPQNENATPVAVNAASLKKRPSFSDLVRKSFKKEEKEAEHAEPRKRRPSFSEIMKKSFSRGDNQERVVAADARSEAASETSTNHNPAEPTATFDEESFHGAEEVSLNPFDEPVVGASEEAVEQSEEEADKEEPEEEEGAYEQNYAYTLTPIKEETPSAETSPLPVDNTPIPTNVEVLVEDMIADCVSPVATIEVEDKDIVDSDNDVSEQVELCEPRDEYPAEEETAVAQLEELSSPAKEQPSVIDVHDEMPLSVEQTALNEPVLICAGTEVVEEAIEVSVAPNYSSRRDMLGAAFMLVLMTFAVILHAPRIPEARSTVHTSKALQAFVPQAAVYHTLEPTRIVTSEGHYPEIDSLKVDVPAIAATNSAYPLVSAKLSLNPLRFFKRLICSIFNRFEAIFGRKQNV